MALLTTIALTIGGALVKHVVAGYLGDGVKSQVAPDLLDLVRDQLGDGLAARPQQPSIEQVAQQVTQKLLPIFVQESRDLDPATREAIVLAVAQTLATSKIDADLLLQQRLDPARLANTLHEKAATSRAGFSPDETTLYRRLLTESCRQLVYIANHFAGYEILVDRRLLTGQDQILAQLMRLLTESDERTRAYVDAYRVQLSKQLNKFELIGINYAEDATNRQMLDVAYVSLRLMQSDGDPFDGYASKSVAHYYRNKAAKRERTLGNLGPLQEMLQHAPRLVIQGQPGSGKSTLLRWLAIQIAQRTLSREHLALASWDDCIPFYIQLRTFANKALPTPSEWPTLHVRQLALKPPDTWMHEVLSDGRAVVLIDGIDEMPEGQRAELLQWLQEVISTYPWARYIISSRPAAIKLWSDWINWSWTSGFLTLSLQEMELEQSFRFIDQWHNALQQSLPDVIQREEVAALAGPLKQLIRQREPLRQLARNPLLCSMICALHREHPYAMPQNRIKLYQDCVELLMYRRDAERKVGSLADYPPLSNIHEEVVLSNYAYHLMRNGGSEESITEADDYFEQLIQVMNMPGWSGQRLRHYFVARTGLLIEPGEERIAFAHRTFQEFLAAQKIVEENDIGMLIDKAGDDQWRETILLTIGIKGIRPAQSDRLLNGILNKATGITVPRQRNELYLLAVACLEIAIYLTPLMRRHILAQAAGLFPPPNGDTVALIVKGGDPIGELLRFNPNYSFQKMARCVDALITMGSEQALNAVIEYATSPSYEYPEAWPLRRAIVRGLFTFEPHYYCQRVLTHVRMLDLTDAPLTDNELIHFQKLSRLKSLDLAYTQVSDAGLSYLSNLHELELLDLSSTQISDNGLWHLQNLTKLQSLSLIQTQVTDTGLLHLQGLPELRSLDLDSTQVTDIGLACLQNLDTLQSLDLDSIQVSDAGLVYLQGLRKLQSLWLSYTQITETGLLYLKDLPLLHSLYLYGTSISSIGLTYLQGLPHLRELHLSDIPVNEIESTHLQNWPNLQILYLSYSHINNDGLAKLQGLTSLYSLYLRNTQVSNLGLSYLQSLPNLQTLYLGGTEINDAGLDYLKNLVNLQALDLRNLSVSDVGLADLKDLSNLRILDLRNTQVTDAGLVYLQGLTKLKSLYLMGTQVKDTSTLDHLLGLDIEL